MTKPVEFEPEAQAELHAAIDWYGSRAPVLAPTFAQELGSAIEAPAFPARRRQTVGCLPSGASGTGLLTTRSSLAVETSCSR